MSTTTTARESIAANVRRLRAELGLTQDDVAMAMQELGIEWGRSSVAMLERVARAVTVDELLVLPMALERAARRRDRGRPVTLADLTRPSSGALAVTPQVVLTRRQVDEWLGASPPVSRRPRLVIQSVSEVDEKAAVALGVDDVSRVIAAAFDLWGRPLAEHRDALVRGRVAASASPRTIQAVRGHVTRDLLAELRGHLGLEEA